MKKAPPLKNTARIDRARTLKREAVKNTNMFFRIELGPNVSIDFNSNEADFWKKFSDVSVERFTRHIPLGMNFSSCGDLEYCILNLSVPSNSSFWLFAFFSSMRAVT